MHYAGKVLTKELTTFIASDCVHLFFSFWQEILKAIQEMTTYKLQNNPTSLLHLWPETEVPSHKECIVALLLSLAAIEIASKRKTPK